MRSFFYTIKTPILHTRHAGLLVREAKRFQSEITLTKGDQSVNAKGILAVIGLGVREGDLIKLTIEGPDEAVAEPQLRNYLWAHF
jgi:phosphocarrier protein